MKKTTICMSHIFYRKTLGTTNLTGDTSNYPSHKLNMHISASPLHQQPCTHVHNIQRYSKSVDTPLKYCACHSKCKRHLDACLKTQHKQPICDEIYNADIVKSWIWNVPQMVRPSHITANMLRTVADGCDRKIYAEGTPIQPFAVHSGTIERTETSKLNSSSVQC